jgi:hypothetical protein
MALQLPPLRDPPAPADPPTLADIYEARRYTNNIITSRSKLVIHFTTPNADYFTPSSYRGA